MARQRVQKPTRRGIPHAYTVVLPNRGQDLSIGGEGYIKGPAEMAQPIGAQPGDDAGRQRIAVAVGTWRIALQRCRAFLRCRLLTPDGLPHHEKESNE